METLEQEVDKIYKQGLELVENAELGKALAFLQTQPNVVKKSNLLLRLQGFLQDQLGYVQNAAETYRAAVDLCPSEPKALSGLGIALLQLGKTQEGLQTLIESNENTNDPGLQVSNYRLIANSLLINNKIREAETIIDKLNKTRDSTKTRPTKTDFFLLGHLNLMKGNYEKSSTDFENALVIENDETSLIREQELRYYNGLALMNAGDSDKAILEFKKAVQLEPRNTNYWQMLIQLYVAKKKYDEAISASENVMKIVPNSPVSYSILANAYASKGDFLKDKDLVCRGLEIIDKGISLDPSNFQSLMMKANILLDVGEHDKAEKIVDQVRNLHPKDIDIPLFYTRKYGRQGRFYESILSCLDGMGRGNDSFLNMSIFSQHLYDSIKQLPKIDEVITDLESIFEANNHDTRIGILLTSLLDFAHEEQESDRISGLLIDKLIDDPEFASTLAPIDYKSKNPVRFPLINPLSKNMYIIKTIIPEKNPENEKERLRHEANVMRSLSQISDKVPKVLYYKDGFLFERQIRAPNLNELNNSDFDAVQISTEFRKSLETLMEIQFCGATQLRNDGIILPAHSYSANLRRRLIDRLRATPQLEAFYQVYMQFFNEQLTSIPDKEIFNSLIHRNAHAGNTLVGGYWVDWESPAIGNALIDVVELLNNPEFPDIQPEELAREQIQKILALKQQTGTKLPRGIEQSAQQLYSITKLHNHIELIGSMLVQRRQEHAQYHYDNAVEMLSMYKEPELARKLKIALS